MGSGGGGEINHYFLLKPFSPDEQAQLLDISSFQRSGGLWGKKSLLASCYHKLPLYAELPRELPFGRLLTAAF